MNLKIIRAVQGINQYELNQRTSIPQSKISLIERGYAMPKEEEKIAIANALGFKVDEIEWGTMKNENKQNKINTNK
jgi:transcriptional regulator with XRE-family HTH domain